jgi:hypothetical protein
MEGDPASECDREVCSPLFLHFYILQHPSMYRVILITSPINFSAQGFWKTKGGGGVDKPLTLPIVFLR